MPAHPLAGWERALLAFGVLFLAAHAALFMAHVSPEQAVTAVSDALGALARSLMPDLSGV